LKVVRKFLCKVPPKPGVVQVSNSYINPIAKVNHQVV